MDGTMNLKSSKVKVYELEGGANFLTKLEGMLLAQASREGKRQRLNCPIDSRLKIRIFYGALSPVAPKRKHTGYFRIDDDDNYDIYCRRVSNGLLKRLESVCGGYHNIQAYISLQFGTKEDKMTLDYDFEDLTMNNELSFGSYFNLTESLAQKWNTDDDFSGTLSLILRVNDEALNLIHLGGLGVNDLINRKLLEDAKETGDGIIVVENGKEFACHKAILSAHSDVFKAMFSSDMKEGKSSRVTMSDMSEEGVKALLAYLYCCDIMEALKSSLVAVELLKSADKYGIDKLFETMKDLILAKDYTWFSVEAAVQLLTIVRNRTDKAEFKEMEKKAELVLKSKPVSELKECAEFSELFDNSD